MDYIIVYARLWKKQVETIKKYFNNILKSDGSRTVRYIKEITNLEELLYYINQGDKKTNRNIYDNQINIL